MFCMVIIRKVEGKQKSGINTNFSTTPDPVLSCHNFCLLTYRLLIFLGSLSCRLYGLRLDWSMFILFASMKKSGLKCA